MEPKKKHPHHSENIASTYSIFQQPWWLDAVAPGQWDEISIPSGGQVVARLPFVTKKRFGLTYLLSPPLTPALGPWLRATTAKYTTELSRQKKLFEELIERLPKFDLFRQNFSPKITNWLPFYWAGFKQTTLYTYRIEDLTGLDRVWKDFRENIRREIRKAKKIVSIRDDLEFDKFIDIYYLTFKRQGIAIPHQRKLLYRLDDACQKHNARRILFAHDKENRIHAVVYFVWDQTTGYYLMGGGDPALRNSGAGSLLMWEAIQFASRVTKVFDFEGTMIEPIERFFRAFGAKQVPFFQVTKMSRRMQALISCRDLLRATLSR